MLTICAFIQSLEKNVNLNIFLVDSFRIQAHRALGQIPARAAAVCLSDWLFLSRRKKKLDVVVFWWRPPLIGCQVSTPQGCCYLYHIFPKQVALSFGGCCRGIKSRQGKSPTPWGPWSWFQLLSSPRWPRVSLVMTGWFLRLFAGLAFVCTKSLHGSL